MARPPNADGQRTRQAILDAALALFADKGYFGTSLRDVAGTVGVRESALYNYFASKEALFEALLSAHSVENDERLSALLGAPHGDPRARLEQLTESILERFVLPRQQQLFRILMSDGMRRARAGRINLLERMGGSKPRLEAFMQHLIAAGCLQDEDPDLLVMQFVGPLLFWRQLHAMGVRTPAIRQRRAFARLHVDHFLSGAAARPSAASRARRARTA
jgi:AcrR family transcriptional regulator